MSLQELFDRIKANQKEKKEISASYRDALSNSDAYQKVLDQLKSLKAQKIRIEENLQRECSSEYAKMKSLQKEIDEDNRKISDLAMVKLMQKERLEITDSYQNKYEPVFKVTFRKSN